MAKKAGKKKLTPQLGRTLFDKADSATKSTAPASMPADPAVETDPEVLSKIKELLAATEARMAAVDHEKDLKAFFDKLADGKTRVFSHPDGSKVVHSENAGHRKTDFDALGRAVGFKLIASFQKRDDSYWTTQAIPAPKPKEEAA